MTFGSPTGLRIFLIPEEQSATKEPTASQKGPVTFLAPNEIEVWGDLVDEGPHRGRWRSRGVSPENQVGGCGGGRFCLGRWNIPPAPGTRPTDSLGAEDGVGVGGDSAAECGYLQAAAEGPDRRWARRAGPGVVGVRNRPRAGEWRVRARLPCDAGRRNPPKSARSPPLQRILPLPVSSTAVIDGSRCARFRIRGPAYRR